MYPNFFIHSSVDGHLSCFSHVQLCATPYMAAHQAPLSLGFSRQEYWNGLPLPSPRHACMLSRFSHVRLCATPWTAGSSVHRILQARILEWVAISPSKIPYTNAYIRNLERWYQRIYLQGSNGETDIENRLMDIQRGEERVWCMERVTWKLTLPYIK